ncbi:MAG: ABC transporter permease [Planctomycetota bacterium]|jgi:peptide/nickel transport system permease protein|nr:ABC transporter permease [Planctomycetota bacterium]
MKSYLGKRFVGMVAVMFMVATVTFVVIRVIPGDPAALMLGPEATAVDIEALRSRLGLDLSLATQYLTFLSDLLRGDLGNSIFLGGRPVLRILADRAEPTVCLTLIAIVVAMAVGIPSGIISASRRGSLADQATVSVAMGLASAPSFWLGLAFMQFFSVRLGWFPTSGYGDPGAEFLERMRHLALPGLVLGLVNSALITRFTRTTLLDILSDDYIRTARAKGLGEWPVIMRHAFRNALVPILTVVGLTLALLLGGAVVTETVFNIPGVGNLVVSSVLRRDYPVIGGSLLVIAGVYVLVNLAVDLAYLLIDPRVKY